jgi:outer membrane lipoprotein-sorting protein
MITARSPRSRIDGSIRATRLCVSFLAAILFVAVPADASEKQVDAPQQPDLLRLLRESREPYGTFATRFVQHKHLDMLDVNLVSEGMIFFSRPGSVRYEIVSPVRSLMVYDGKKVRCYAFSEDKWHLLNNPGVTAIGQMLRQIGRWIQGDFDADRKMFEISVVPSAEGGSICLVPRSEALAQYIRRIEIHVEKRSGDYGVDRVVIRESDVDTTEMRFRQELRNRPVPEGTFSSPDASDACRAVFPPEEKPDPNEAGKSKS